MPGAGGRSPAVTDPGMRTPAGPMTRQPSGGRRFFSISSSSRPRGRNWPAWPVVRKTAKRVIEWPRNAAAMPPVTAVTQPPARPTSHRHDEHVAVPAGRPQPRRERVEQRLDHVRDGRVQAGHQQQAEDGAAERDFVDERRGDRVDEGSRVRPDVGQAEPVVAVERDADGDARADRAVQEAEQDRPSPVLARPEQELVLRRGMDEEDRDDDAEPEAIPGDPAAERGRSAVLGLVVLGGIEVLGLETEHDEEEREAGRDRTVGGSGSSPPPG